MTETARQSRASKPAGGEPVETAPNIVANLRGKDWLLVPANGEKTKQSPAANKGISFAAVFALVASVFAIVGAVALFINPRFDDLNQHISRLESKISIIEARMTSFEGELTKLDGKLNAIGDMIVIAFQDGELDSEEIRSIWRQASQ